MALGSIAQLVALQIQGCKFAQPETDHEIISWVILASPSAGSRREVASKGMCIKNWLTTLSLPRKKCEQVS